MTLDPQAQVLCDAMNQAPALELEDSTLDMQRMMFGALLSMAGEPERCASVEDRDAGGVPVRIYRPADSPAGELPVVFWIHGGGWTIGTVEQYDPINRQVANASGAIVVSPDYRLAPEHPFPAPLDDCWTALQWTAQHAAEFGGDATRLAIGGDSAGGNLSAVCSLLARDAGGPQLALQALVYPVTDGDFTTQSYVDNGAGYLLDLPQMKWFFDCYTRGGVDPFQWKVSPLRVDSVEGVAPAVVVTGEYDPLRDEGEAYARRLADAGALAAEHRYPGMVHAFFGLSAAFDASKEAMQLVGTELRRAFGTLA